MLIYGPHSPPVEGPLTAAVFVLGAVLGVTVGIAYAMARRGWKDYRTTKSALPVARKAAWALTRIAVTKGGILVLLCIAAVGWAAVSGDR